MSLFLNSCFPSSTYQLPLTISIDEMKILVAKLSFPISRLTQFIVPKCYYTHVKQLIIRPGLNVELFTTQNVLCFVHDKSQKANSNTNEAL